MTPKSCLRRTRPVGVLMLAIPVSAVALTAGPADAQSRTSLSPLAPLRTALTPLAPARTPLTPLTPLAPLRTLTPHAPLRTLTPHAPLTPRARVTRDRARASSGGAGLPLGPRARLSVDRAGASSGGAAITPAVPRQSIASWYDDAGSTACGFHARLGVANRDLPCGTRVTFRYGAHTVTAVVDDRGPYVAGRDWDFNQSTAAALGFSGVGTVSSSR